MDHVGRPRVGDRISVRLPDDLRRELDRRADAAGVTRAEAIRQLLTRALRTNRGDGVDRTQIAHRLALTPAQRISIATEEARTLLALRDSAR